MRKKHIEYKLVLPKGYKKQPLPGRNEWLEALRGGNIKQARGTLCQRNGSKCCLGVHSKLQGRLIWSEEGYSDDPKKDELLTGSLAATNPLFSILRRSGVFPAGVTVIADGEVISHLASCNDEGRLNFLQIADIIERVWKHAGPLPK